MAKGLDVGTMNLIAAERRDDKTTLTQQRNSFVEVPLNEVSRRLLNKSDVLHVEQDDNVFVLGEDALRFANVLNVPTRRPMQQGVLSKDESSAIPMIRVLLDKLLGEPAERHETVYFTTPARPSDAPERDVLYHQRTLEAVLRGLGYKPTAINEGLAVVYSELAQEQFTGLGLSFGAGLTNVCLSHYGIPIMTTAVGRGGDWIDRQVSLATGESTDRVTAIKESRFDLTDPKGGEVHAALAIYYEELVEQVIRDLDRQSRKARILEDLKVPVAVTGGVAAAKGFRDLFEQKLDEAALPFEVSGVRLAKNPLYSVAIGALVAARTEEPEQVDVSPKRQPTKKAKKAVRAR